MKAILSILLTLFIFCRGKAQVFVEKVYLKDSTTVYEGYIIEQAPAKYIKIYRIKEKDTILVNLNEVWRLTKNYTIDSVKSSIKTAKPLPKNRYTKAAFAELLGNGILFSLNYDMRTAKNVRDKWGFRIGIEHEGINVSDTTGTNLKAKLTTVPFSINYLIGKKKGFLELGMGASYALLKVNGSIVTNGEVFDITLLNENFSNMYGTFNIGYRHVPYKNGLMYSIAFTPKFILGQILSYVGIGIGYHFN